MVGDHDGRRGENGAELAGGERIQGAQAGVEFGRSQAAQAKKAAQKIFAGFLVVSFLCWGIYILEDAFANPLEAGAAAIISAAFIIAMGAILLFFSSNQE